MNNEKIGDHASGPIESVLLAIQHGLNAISDTAISADYRLAGVEIAGLGHPLKAELDALNLVQSAQLLADASRALHNVRVLSESISAAMKDSIRRKVNRT